jgi:ABC-type nitrate/sulfonate/bicarbonate transport system substrate-binding protein
MARSALLIIAAAAVAAVIADGVAVSATGAVSGATTKLRIGLEWFLNPDHMPFVVAEREGFFAEAGLEVELVAPADHWEAEKEILAGRLDVAVTETLHLAQDAANAKPIIGFSRFLHTDGGVMYFAGGNISRPRDMCGATITYPGSPGPGGPAIVQTMVEADGGTCDMASYRKFNGGFDHVGALAEGKADVATLIFANFEIPFASAAGHDARFFSLKEWGVPDFCQLVLMTTPDRFAALKPALRSLVLAMRRATGVIHREPERAKALYQQAESEMPMSTLDQTLPMFPNDNSLSSDYFDHLMGWLVETKQVAAESRGIAPAVYWTNEVALP